MLETSYSITQNRKVDQPLRMRGLFGNFSLFCPPLLVACHDDDDDDDDDDHDHDDDDDHDDDAVVNQRRMAGQGK